jgi:hypothetical protein
MRSVCCTTSLNTGRGHGTAVDTCPLLGSSIITATTMRGLSIGAMPVNQDAVFVGRVALADLLVGRAGFATDRITHGLGLLARSAGASGHLQHLAHSGGVLCREDRDAVGRLRHS